MKTEVIHISISGAVQVGKSAVLAQIKAMLEAYGYCVAIPDREERNNPSRSLVDASAHERPSLNGAVFVLTESVVKS
jgi:nucleoside-triphosphatase THEP1